MPDTDNEDLIEATIRRVAEAKAAREQSTAVDNENASPDDLPPPSSGTPGAGADGSDDDPIGDTVRRIQAHRAASLAAAGAEDEPWTASAGPDEDAIEETIRRVQAQKAAADAIADVDAPEAPAITAAHVGEDSIEEATQWAPEESEVDEQGDVDAELAPSEALGTVDEDKIEETIRRVQAQKAAADAAAHADVPPVAAIEDDDDPIAATIRRVRAQKAARDASFDEESDEIAPTPIPTGQRQEDAMSPIVADVQINDPETFEPVSEVSANDDAIARVERSLREANQLIASLSARVEALERAAQHQPGQVTAFPRQLQSEVEEEDTQQLAQAAHGSFSAPRPAVRDTAPAVRLALAEQLPEPEVIDNRPLPKPLPPLQVEPRRGLDLLPRTYRITVEDKRRGVDLVPLHRALLSMDGVRDMSLLSYNNGVAIVALETAGDLDSDALGTFVSRAMSRRAKVEQHNEHTFVVKLAED